ncbi:hypothetical protein [Tenacibaculum adriaticum]|uniref:hypothetical protein n=1 Tax=Tenacibaculum adriaticum TaxID=413713 RepID=UPI001478FFE6|nr:hypothetical protein [Tenacibaculum adriaticum]
MKYGARQTSVSEFFILFSYILMVVCAYSFLVKIRKFVENISSFNKLYLTVALFCLFIFITITYIVDGNSVNVDRWSAMEVFINNILNGNYPYNQTDHLGKTSSNLPGLFYIGLPFYVLGNVGLLQPLVFSAFIYVLFKSEFSNYNKLLGLVFLLLSPAFFWEILVKSDLMSNVFIVLLFIWYWRVKFKEETFTKPELLALMVSLLVLTRGITIIPLTLFLFNDFLSLTIKKQLYFVCLLVVFSIIICLPIFLNLPDYETLITHNPFNHQTRYAPKKLIIISLIIPFLISKYSNSFYLVARNSMFILLGLAVITLAINILEEGWYNNVYGILFDISYISMILPFLIICLLYESNNLN